MPAKTAHNIAHDTAAAPLDDLSALLAADMKAVNTLILRHMHSDVAMIPQLAGYLIAAGGKRIRPLLTLACTKIFDGDMAEAARLAAAVEFIHTATLLHDDVVDESEERRGQAAANLIFGNQASVLVGDFLFSRAFQLMVETGSLEVLRILSEASAIIAEGEVMQLQTANNPDATWAQYLGVITAKTAALFAAACEIGPVLAGRDKDMQAALRDYGLNLGIAFQIADDVLDYSADRARLGKAVGDDFREGKMTAPVILALAQADDDERAFWRRTMADRNQAEGDLARAQAILQRHGSLEQGLGLARDYAAKAVSSLKNAGNSSLAPILAGLATFTVDRDH